jgi:hypothetical protein
MRNLILLVILCATTSWRAHACDCIGLTPAQAYTSANAVFVGRVTSLDYTNIPILKVQLKILQSWKGATSDSIAVFTYTGGGSCGVGFQNDSVYLVYITPNTGYPPPFTDSSWTNICFRTNLLRWAQDDLAYLNTTGVKNPPVGERLPNEAQLFQSYPNPFNPTTTIRYVLPQRTRVTLTVFNTFGQQVATLVNETEEAGYHDVRFDASGLASGVYFYRLRAGGYVATKRLLLIR